MGGNNLPPFTSNWRIIMKYLIVLFAGLAIGFATAKIGASKILSTTSKGIETSSKVAVKVVDSVNKKIAQ